jgi:hypothetical protein
METGGLNRNGWTKTNQINVHSQGFLSGHFPLKKFKIRFRHNSPWGHYKKWTNPLFTLNYILTDFFFEPSTHQESKTVKK